MGGGGGEEGDVEEFALWFVVEEFEEDVDEGEIGAEDGGKFAGEEVGGGVEGEGFLVLFHFDVDFGGEESADDDRGEHLLLPGCSLSHIPHHMVIEQLRDLRLIIYIR